jgi:hypothetical protein
LQVATVVVVDFRLDDPWKERDERSTVSLKPMDGLALTAVLRSHERTLDGSPTAFVLRSAHLADLSPSFPPDSRLHVLASQYNIEWVLDKQADVDLQMRQIGSLARAMDELPKDWPVDDADETGEIVGDWLHLPEHRWRQLARQDIEDCHPPLHEMSERKHGLRLVRWLAQRILPYPCFLWTDSRLATRLRVTRESLRVALGQGLDARFEPAKYVGQLHDFEEGTRWWRAGIEAILWDVTGGRSFDSAGTREVLNQDCGNSLVPLPLSQPVLCLDYNFRFRKVPYDVADAVRVQPDDWPVYAEQAWAATEDARDEPRLAAAVIATDRHRLSDSTPAEDD